MPLPVLGDPDLARALSGHPDPVDVTPTQIEAGLNYGFDMLKLFTGKVDWTGTENIKEQASRIVEHFCASWVKSWWRDPDNKSQELFNRGKSMCVAMMENMKVVSPNQPTDASYTSVAYTYRTRALNEDAAPYKSLRTDF